MAVEDTEEDMGDMEMVEEAMAAVVEMVEGAVEGAVEMVEEAVEATSFINIFNQSDDHFAFEGSYCSCTVDVRISSVDLASK